MTLLSDITLFELRQICFGENPNELDVDRWHQQGFVFCSNEKVPWGLRQSSGGPCGVLAPVQAWIIDDIFFGLDKPPAGSFIVSPERCQQALVSALARVLFASLPASQSEVFVLVFHQKSPVDAAAAADSDIDPPFQTVFVQVQGRASLIECLTTNLLSFHHPSGVMNFVYSLLLTRGLDGVRSDMDDCTTPLVAQFGHCAQELVNLIITGRAVTNVHDGDKLLGDANDPDAFRLKGIAHHFDIGFLSILELLKYMKVGMHYKAPLHPIWVVGSTSHYTVVFGLDAAIGRLSPQEAALHQAKVLFQNLDPEEIGFVSSTLLSDLQRSIASLQSYSLSDLRRHLDDGGVVLWDSLRRFLSVKNPPNSMTASHPPHAAWTCSACTFSNDALANSCDVCTSPRPPAAAPKRAMSAFSDRNVDPSPDHFALYHFNGLNQQLSQLSVAIVEDMPLQPEDFGADENRGLRELLSTRWPNSLIEYIGTAPKLD